ARQKDIARSLSANAPTGVTLEGGALVWPTRSDELRAERLRRELDPPQIAARLHLALVEAGFDATAFEPGLVRLAELGKRRDTPLPALAQLAHAQRVGALGDRFIALTSLFIATDANGPATANALRTMLPPNNELAGPYLVDLELGESLIADAKKLTGLTVL